MIYVEQIIHVFLDGTSMLLLEFYKYQSKYIEAMIPFTVIVMKGSIYCEASLRPIFSTRIVTTVLPGIISGGGRRVPMA